MKAKYGIFALVAAGALASTSALAQQSGMAPSQQGALQQQPESAAAAGSQPATAGHPGQMGGQGVMSEQQTAQPDPAASPMQMEPSRDTAQTAGEAAPSPVASSLLRELQQALSDAGYDVQVDGMWGTQTSQALRQFQQEQNIESTGQVDLATIRELDLQQMRAETTQQEQQVGALDATGGQQ